MRGEKLYMLQIINGFAPHISETEGSENVLLTLR